MLASTIEILRRYGIKPSKGLGQNFLVDEQVLAQIVQASDLGREDIVLEVGPGVGLLTRRLAEQAGQVVAVELDRKMLAILEGTLGGQPNAHVLQGDILETDVVAALTKVLGKDERELRYKVVANLPYYITSAALRHLLGARVRPVQLVIMVQHEVAQRILAGPGELSLLAISVRVYGQAELVCKVPARAFFPPPKVDSAVLRVQVFPEPQVGEMEREHFFRVVHAGFAQKRKQVHNSLGHGLNLPAEQVLAALREAGISAERRAQTLTIEEWRTLTKTLSAR